MRIEVIIIKILTREVVSNSDIIKNYKHCREMAQNFGKIFIWKNNQPDAVLFSISRYKEISKVIEYVDSLDDKELAEFLDTLPKEE